MCLETFKLLLPMGVLYLGEFTIHSFVVSECLKLFDVCQEV